MSSTAAAIVGALVGVLGSAVVLVALELVRVRERLARVELELECANAYKRRGDDAS